MFLNYLIDGKWNGLRGYPYKCLEHAVKGSICAPFSISSLSAFKAVLSSSIGLQETSTLVHLPLPTFASLSIFKRFNRQIIICSNLWLSDITITWFSYDNVMYMYSIIKKSYIATVIFRTETVDFLHVKNTLTAAWAHLKANFAVVHPW